MGFLNVESNADYFSWRKAPFWIILALAVLFVTQSSLALTDYNAVVALESDANPAEVKLLAQRLEGNAVFSTIMVIVSSLALVGVIAYPVYRAIAKSKSA